MALSDHLNELAVALDPEREQLVEDCLDLYRALMQGERNEYRGEAFYTDPQGYVRVKRDAGFHWVPDPHRPGSGLYVNDEPDPLIEVSLYIRRLLFKADAITEQQTSLAVPLYALGAEPAVRAVYARVFDGVFEVWSDREDRQREGEARHVYHQRRTESARRAWIAWYEREADGGQ